jgi:hypothetical protein
VSSLGENGGRNFCWGGRQGEEDPRGDIPASEAHGLGPTLPFPALGWRSPRQEDTRAVRFNVAGVLPVGLRVIVS